MFKWKLAEQGDTDAIRQLQAQQYRENPGVEQGILGGLYKLFTGSNPYGPRVEVRQLGKNQQVYQTPLGKFMIEVDNDGKETGRKVQILDSPPMVPSRLHVIGYSQLDNGKIVQYVSGSNADSDLRDVEIAGGLKVPSRLIVDQGNFVPSMQYHSIKTQRFRKKKGRLMNK